MDITKLSLVEVAQAIKSGKLSSQEVVRATLDRIEKNKDVNAFITVCGEKARRIAKEVDDRLAKGDRVGILAGVPIAVKDNISATGMTATCGSAFLSDYTPVYDATVVTKLKNAGAIIIGKTNMDEFAMGSENKNSAFGAVLNPVDKTTVPGGSSGGSAAAVADFECYGALGTDTGGSIRQPASYCGVVGMKPTNTAVSRYGLIAFASSLDNIGTLTRSVRDNAVLLSVIAGKDGLDSTSSSVENDYYDYSPVMKGRRIGVVKQFMESEILSDDVKKTVYEAIKTCEKAGAKLVDMNLKCYDGALADYYVLCCAEASSNLARFDGIRYGTRVSGGNYDEICTKSRTAGFGAEVKRRIMLGNFVLSGENYDKYYVKALKVRAAIKREMNQLLENCDALCAPAAPSTAVKIDKTESDMTKIYYSDQFAVFASLSGMPSMSVPCGVCSDGLPMGMLFTGKHFDEKTLYSMAEAFERERS